ncbi:hypothetical protein GCM10023339_46570 [Alloalcanivorax gelatiniphagus]
MSQHDTPDGMDPSRRLAALRDDVVMLRERVPMQDIPRDWRLDARVTDVERRLDGIVDAMGSLVEVVEGLAASPREAT